MAFINKFTHLGAKSRIFEKYSLYLNFVPLMQYAGWK